MTTEKCKTCRWYVVVSYENGKDAGRIDNMCHWNWKCCEEEKTEECNHKKKNY